MLRLLAAASMLLGSLCFSSLASPAARAEGTGAAPAAAAPDAQLPPASPAARPAPARPDNQTGDKSADNKEQVLTIVVAGDSIADGIWGGLYRMLQRDKRYNIVREAKNSSGFTAFDWVAEMGGILKTQRVDAIVFLVGANDRQTLIVRDKPRTLFRTTEWLEGYGERVNAFMEFVKARNIPLVWVGLPVARKADFNKDSQYLNDIYAAAAKKNAIMFVDIWTMFMDKAGEYSAYLPDAAGKNQLLRHNDGVHFTPAGYELIAEQVLATLRRNVPAFGEAAKPPADKPQAAPPDAPPATTSPQSKIAPPDAPANPPPVGTPIGAPPGQKAQQSADGGDAKRVEELKKNDDAGAIDAPEMNALREPRPKTTRKR